MKKAVIQTGNKQYLVSEGDEIKVELIKTEGKSITLKPLLIIDGDNVNIGLPLIDKSTVTAEVIEADVQTEKVTSIRFKAKKRVHKTRGHRQHVSVLKIKSIA
ncbi:MAG TPA: 50S ribosomal protein L21 [Candidatus Saccharimonadales bacterium]|nr:50S ribosomal protein L21 [Candidatus Saccharimonadales bacterium]